MTTPTTAVPGLMAQITEDTAQEQEDRAIYADAGLPAEGEQTPIEQ